MTSMQARVSVVGLLLAITLPGCTGGRTSAHRNADHPTATPGLSGQRAARLLARERALERRRALEVAHRRAAATAKPCRASTLRLRLQSVGAGAGTYYQLFVLKNRAKEPCVVGRLEVSYADGLLKTVGYRSVRPGRFLDESAAKRRTRRVLLGGERVVLRVGTVGPGAFGSGCGERPVSNEVLMVNKARFVLHRQDASVCTIKKGRPSVDWGAPPAKRHPPHSMPQPHQA